MTKRQRIKTCQRRGCEGRRTRPISKGFLSKPNPCTLHLGPRDKPIRFLLLSYSAYGTQTGESIVRKPIYIFFLSKLIGVTLVNKIIQVSSVQFYNISSSAYRNLCLPPKVKSPSITIYSLPLPFSTSSTSSPLVPTVLFLVSLRFVHLFVLFVHLLLSTVYPTYE